MAHDALGVPLVARRARALAETSRWRPGRTRRCSTRWWTIQRAPRPDAGLPLRVPGRHVRLVRDGRQRPRALGVPHAAGHAGRRPGDACGRSITSRCCATSSWTWRRSARRCARWARRWCRPRPPSLRADPGRLAPSGRSIDAAIECIGCGMCVSACTMVAHNERFPGPGRAQPRVHARARLARRRRRARGGRCCSTTTRSPAATARATAPRCARWAWRRPPRSFACARWPHAGCSACR